MHRRTDGRGTGGGAGGADSDAPPSAHPVPLCTAARSVPLAPPAWPLSVPLSLDDGEIPYSLAALGLVLAWARWPPTASCWRRAAPAWARAVRVCSLTLARRCPRNVGAPTTPPPLWERGIRDGHCARDDHHRTARARRRRAPTGRRKGVELRRHVPQGDPLVGRGSARLIRPRAANGAGGARCPARTPTTGPSRRRPTPATAARPAPGTARRRPPGSGRRCRRRPRTGFV